jgi:hypothetical protein
VERGECLISREATLLASRSDLAGTREATLLGREGFGLMHPRRSTRRRRYSSGSGTRRLLLIAAVTSVPVLVIGYALTTGHGGRAVDTADVTGTSMESAGNAAEATPSALAGADADAFTVDDGAAGTAGPGPGHRHRHRHHGLGG